MSDRSGSRGAASPVVVFLCLLLLLAGISGAVIWTGQIEGEPIPPGPVPSASPEPSPDTTLTDEEAIAVFKDLDALRLRAFETRNATLLPDIFVSPGSEVRRARETISKLRRDQVVMEHDPYRNRSISVLHRSPHRIEIEQEVVFHIIFRNEAGQKVPQQGLPELLTVQWILNNVDGEWLIRSGEVTDAQPYESS